MTQKVPVLLVATARLSGGITSVVSITYIVLSIVGLIYYFNCWSVQTPAHADYFWSIVYQNYLQHDDCQYSIHITGLTRSFTVFVLMSVTLALSLVNLGTAIVLTGMINNKDRTQYMNAFVYAYIGSWVSTLVVDLTLATHLGMDITFLSRELNNANLYVPLFDVLRQGAFYLMAISLKGFVLHALQLGLICVMIYLLYVYKESSKMEQHPIHKLGSINAFDQRRGLDDSIPNMYSIELMPRGQLNHNYANERLERTHQNDYYNHPRDPGSFRRSDSWHHGSPTARPFSYLEETRRAPPATPAPVLPPAPRVPAPDYSPHSQRRLKSALKTNYI